MDLSNQGLTKIIASGATNTTEALVTFTFYTGESAVRQTASAVELALETELLLRNNALTTIPAALFRALQSVKRV